MMNVHPLVQQYVNDVCRQVKARELRKDINEELESHFLEEEERKRRRPPPVG